MAKRRPGNPVKTQKPPRHYLTKKMHAERKKLKNKLLRGK